MYGYIPHRIAIGSAAWCNIYRGVILENVDKILSKREKNKEKIVIIVVLLPKNK